jgi:hypothetical protein
MVVMIAARSLGLLMAGAFLCGGALSAQEPLAGGDRRHGGFGGPVVKFTEIDDRFGVLVGGRGGWIINGSLVIGGGGYALANVGSFENLTNGAGDPGGLEMAYGGLEFGYVHRPDDRVHVSLGLLIGAGGVTWNPDGQAGGPADDAFFVFEPELDVVLTATGFLRVALGASYRLTQGVELFDLDDADLSGLAGLVMLKFGSF